MTVREAFEEEVCCIQIWARVHFDILGTISIFNGARNHVWDTEYKLLCGDWDFLLFIQHL